MSGALPEPVITVGGLNDLLNRAFPDRTGDLPGRVVALSTGFARLELEPQPHMGRPGGLVSGPTQMGLADHAAYAVILAHAGPLLMAVTHTLTISFLRGCQYAPLTADASLLKLGRRLATVDVRLWQGSADRVVAQATVGYALPPA